MIHAIGFGLIIIGLITLRRIDVFYDQFGGSDMTTVQTTITLAAIGVILALVQFWGSSDDQDAAYPAAR